MIYLLLFFIDFFLAYFMFQPSLAISNLFGAIDIPNNRKIHSKPTARGGGFSFFVAFSLLLIAIPINIDLKIPLVLSGSVIFLIGFLDDIIDLSPFMKLSGQFFALAVYFFTAELLDYGLTAFQSILIAIWIILITNSTNIIDGLDGLAGGICSSQALCLAVISLIFRNYDILLCSFFLLGATLGFLPRNFPKAHIFMGDCGALFLGFTLAVLSSRLVIESRSIPCLLSVLFVFMIPLCDTNLSISRRIAKRENPFKADKGHFHHQLLRKGFSNECTTLALITIALFFGFLGIILSSI